MNPVDHPMGGGEGRSSGGHPRTADFCPSNCVNELAVWRVTKDDVFKELSWKPAQPWDDAGVSWKDAGTLVLEYTPAGGAPASTLERRLTDPGWRRADAP